jgi:hypothetical protein
MTRPKLHPGARGCTCRCPGGGECVCNPDVKHQLHICRHEDCHCHTEARYIAAKRHARAARGQPKEILPIPVALATANRKEAQG